MAIVKIGPVELTPEEAQKYMDENKFIVTYSKIYKIVHNHTGYHGKEVYTSRCMTRRGRFYAMDAKDINKLFGLSL